MPGSGRFSIKSSAKQRSFLLSFLFFFILFLATLFIANFKRGNLFEKLNELLAPQKMVKSVIRENKNKFSFAHFYQNGELKLPQQLIIGVYESGNDLFYHEFIDLTKQFESFSSFEFALINVSILDEKKAFDDFCQQASIKECENLQLPMMMYFYQQKELEKFRLNLQFTSLLKEPMLKRTRTFINLFLKHQPK